MGRLIKFLLLCTLLLLLVLPAGFYFMVLSDKPMALPSPHLDQNELMKLQRMLAQQVSRVDPEGRVTLSLNEAETDTAVTFGLQTANLPPVVGAVFDLAADHATLRGSVQLPIDTGRNFLNIHATLQPDGNTPRIAALQLGYLNVPAFLIRQAELRAWAIFRTDERFANYRASWESVEDISIDNHQLNIVYRITSASLGGIPQKLALDQIDSDSIRAQLAHLEPISRKISSGRYPLMGMLVPAYELAHERTAAGHDPVAENSAALLSLAMYTADPSVLELLGLVERFGSPARRMTLTLHRRPDLASHFLTSALITMIAGDQLAMLMGMQKELDDSQTNSGFSVEDLVADKAGIRFAEQAIANPASARDTQARLLQLLYDDELMPAPDTLSNIEQDLASVDERELEAQLSRIDRQINNLLARMPLYQ